MIKFVSSVDDIETEELEGRIVMQRIMQDWPAFRHPSRVVQKTPNSAIIERLHANYDDVRALWVFTEKSAGEQQVIRLAEIKAICDSADEANAILQKSREALDQFYKTRDKLTLEFARLAANYKDGPVSQTSLRSCCQ
ncbi:hypothetical protein HFO56_23530 [Rhizobium laguerreae]|uniref:hypothetical protein n=1 Tax=Rhizobium laguerreae TaxID=1076926 RepID=UPI001C906F7B|nr:hypothetical protein [Rhizobium laguerreae]MBY3155298.1 hypothetical protein [Rhizobium laguerreae]